MAVLSRLRNVWLKASFIAILLGASAIPTRLFLDAAREPVANIRTYLARERRDNGPSKTFKWAEDSAADIAGEAISRGFQAIEDYDHSFWARGVNTWYVSPSGSGTTCSSPSPCSLQTSACSSGSCSFARAPGDTIILKDGTYTAPSSTLHTKFWGGGTSGNNITWRAEHWRSAIIDCKLGTVNAQNGGKCFDGTSFGNADYLTLQDLVFTNSSTASRSTLPEATTGQDNVAERSNPMEWQGLGNRIIHVIAKNGSNGIQGGGSTEGLREMYWIYSYYQGYEFTDRGHGHAVYCQNHGVDAPGSCLAADYSTWDSIIGWRNGAEGFQAYTETGEVNCMTIKNNVEFLDGINTTGTWSTTNGYASYTFGANGAAACNSSKTMNGPFITDNEAYDNRAGAGAKLGFAKGIINGSVTGNYWASGGNAVTATGLCAPTDVSSNTFYGTLSGMTCNQWGSGNTCVTALPTTPNRIVYQVYKYGAGEGRAIVYNWTNAATVQIDPGQMGGYSGEQYNLYTTNSPMTPISSATWNGSALLTVNTSGYTVEDPTGDWDAPDESGPKFNVFFIEPQAIATTPVPSNTPTFTKTFTPTLTRTNTPSFTPTKTNTPSQTPTPSVTPSQSPTPASTSTSTPSVTATFTVTATPTTTPSPGPLTSLSFEAESCTVAAPMVKTSDVTVFGGQYVSSPTTSNGQLTCQVTVSTAGTYRVWTRVYNATSASDSFYSQVDADVALCATDGDTTCTHIYDTASSKAATASVCALDRNWGRWIWNKLNDRAATATDAGCGTGEGNERLLTLTAGVHTIVFRQRDPDTRLDRIILTTDMNYQPEDFALTPTPTRPPYCHFDLCNGRAKTHCSVPHAKSDCPWPR